MSESLITRYTPDSIRTVLDQYLQENITNTANDDSHSIGHFNRVLNHALKVSNVDPYIMIPAALLHDCYYVKKDSNLRRFASRISAAEALKILSEYRYPEKYYQDIYHAIAAHSFSAGITPETLEAKALQDADRLDALGYIGIFRCIYSGKVMNSEYLAHPTDPTCELRLTGGSTEPLDDKKYILDHFVIKLEGLTFITPELQEESAKAIAIIRYFRVNWAQTSFLCDFIKINRNLEGTLKYIRCVLEHDPGMYNSEQMSYLRTFYDGIMEELS